MDPKLEEGGTLLYGAVDKDDVAVAANDFKKSRDKTISFTAACVRLVAFSFFMACIIELAGLWL